MPDVPVLYADDDLVVVDKPSGLLVVPAPGRSAPTLVDVLGAQLGRRVYAVHRLDEETTGCIVLAADEDMREPLERVFRTHAAHREYLALAAAMPSPEAGRIEANLQEGKDGIVRVVTRGGQRAITHYEAIARRGRCSLLRCRIETGRRNQIRVHLAALGCPVAGDRKYGFRARGGESYPRVMLHSWRLEFRHPRTRELVRCVCEAPEPDLHVD